LQLKKIRNYGIEVINYRIKESENNVNNLLNLIKKKLL